MFVCGTIKTETIDGIYQHVHRAIDFAVMKVRVEMVQWIYNFIPEDTGRLVMNYINNLITFIGEQIHLDIMSEVDYARYVEELPPPVHWTKSSTLYQAAHKASMHLLEIIDPNLESSFARFGLDVT